MICMAFLISKVQLCLTYSASSSMEQVVCVLVIIVLGRLSLGSVELHWSATEVAGQAVQAASAMSNNH